MIFEYIQRLNYWQQFLQIIKKIMSLRNFQILAEIGTGSFASVFKVRRFEDDEIYALKKVKLKSLNEKEKENALNQVRILASLKSPYVIGYKQAFLDRETASLCLITEFADDGDLEKKIEHLKKNKQIMEQNLIWNYVHQMAKALKSLHGSNIVHRDLKCANIFLFKDERLKIGDMNVSKVLKQKMCETQTGTPYYASPEIWKDKPYNTKSDIWSLGCILYEMMMFNPPFMAEDMQELYKKVMRGIYPKIDRKYSKNLKNLVRMMLQVDSNSRPDISAIVEYIDKSKSRKLSIKIHEPTQEEELNQHYVIKTSKSIPSVLYPENQEEQMGIELIQTIKMPKKLTSVAERLPRSNYNDKNRKEIQSQLKLPFLKKKVSMRGLPTFERPLTKIPEKKLNKARSQKLIALGSLLTREKEQKSKHFLNPL